MKTGYLQFEPKIGDLEQTIQNIEKFRHDMRGADLIVLPELANSGYNFESREQALMLSETTADSKFLRYIVDICKEMKTHIVCGFCEREGGVIYNSALLCNSTGVVGKYRKIHLFNTEKDFFESGNLPLTVYRVGEATIGMLVCFDWMFPELWRLYALRGVDIICHSSNLVLPGFAQQAVPVYALINNLFVITANRIGTENGLTFTGLSTFAAPKGKLLAQAPQAESQLMLVDIDVSLARNKMITPRNHIFDDRRPEFYQ